MNNKLNFRKIIKSKVYENSIHRDKEKQINYFPYQLAKN